MSISISELERIEREMTQGKWKHGSWQRARGEPVLRYTEIAPRDEDDVSITVDSDQPPNQSDQVNIINGCGCCGSPSGRHADAIGICAMRNAFQLLLRIARAAMEYHEARKNPDSSCSIIDARYSALISVLWNAEVQP